MNKTFDVSSYLNILAKDLVNAFDKAGETTHPQAVGSGREKSVKDQLQRLLPAGVGIGSGFVIDSYGNTSKQCDIIIYEKEFALKFSPNDDDLYTYYNCENVIAVGQVKSTASITEIKDSITNLQSVKSLIRRENICDDYMGHKVSSPRPYLGNLSMMPAVSEQYNPNINEFDNIFTFLICNSFSTSAESILREVEAICNHNKKEYPHRFLSVDNHYGFWLSLEKDKNLKTEPMKANYFSFQKVECALGYLIFDLMNFIKEGRSVPNNKRFYFPQYLSVKLESPLYSLT